MAKRKNGTILLVLALALVGGFWYWNQKQSQKPEAQPGTLVGAWAGLVA